MKIRRVVTSHDDKGKAVVAIDEVSRDVVSFRPGATVANIWSTAGFPVDNNGLRDTAKEITATTRAGGTVFRVIEFAPGVAPRNHRTDSIDYAIVLAGEIDMTLDDQVVTLRAGDLLVQRGTIHNWINRSNAPCVIAFVLIDAKPVEHDGKPLAAVSLDATQTKHFFRLAIRRRYGRPIQPGRPARAMPLRLTETGVPCSS